jgi:hypothetical protein
MALAGAFRAHVEEERAVLCHAPQVASDVVRQGQQQLNDTLFALGARCDQADLAGCARLGARFEALLSLQIAREQRILSSR